MSNRNRFADASLGVVFGVGIALLFLVWSVPEFRDPVHSQVSAQDGEHSQSKNNSQFNRTVYWDVLTLDDTLAQWVMGFFTIAATAVSLKAIFLVLATRSRPIQKLLNRLGLPIPLRRKPAKPSFGPTFMSLA